MLRPVFALPLSLLASTLVACSSSTSSTSSSSSGASGSPGGCTAYTTSIDLKAPTVSMKTDVMPILDRACMFSACHGQGSSKGDLKMTKGDASATRASLVGVAAPELKSMKLVEAGDWTKSYLMKKVDGDVCLLKDQCTAPCTDTMPQGNDLLEVAERDTIRRWIAQGAADN